MRRLCSFFSIILVSFSAAGTSYAATTEQPPVFGEWIALGSGCAGSSHGNGDLQLSLPRESQRSHSYSVALSLPTYRLDSVSGNPRKAVNFARQCSFRLALNPPAGMRVKSLQTRTDLLVSKATPVDLTIAYEVKLGSLTVGNAHLSYPAGAEKPLGEEHLVSASAEKSEAAFASKKCGTGTLVGVDQTFLAMRKNNTDAVKVELAGNKRLILDIELEDCKMEQSSHT